MPTTPPAIGALPPAPDPNNRATFNTLAYPWSQALPTFSTQVSAVAANVKANADEAEADAIAADASRVAAAVQATNAANSAAAAAATVATTAIAWVSGTTYAIGDVRYSPINFASYRRRTAGSGTTDPSLDVTNWAPAAGNGFIPVGGLLAFDAAQTGNTVTAPDGAVYLKTGVVAPFATYPNSIAAPYITAGSGFTSIPTNTPVSDIDMVASNGTTVAVMYVNGGLMRRTTDGYTWTNVSANVANIEAGGCVLWSGSLFMAVSGLGKCWTSPDGLTWTQRTTLPTTPNAYAIGYGSGRWLIAASSGTSVWYSTDDGVTWNTGTATSYSFGQRTQIPFGAGVFVLANYAAGASAKVQTSPDGVTWTTRTVSTFTGQAYNCVFGNGYFVYFGNNSASLGSIQTSSDGITWTQRSNEAACAYRGWSLNGDFGRTAASIANIFTCVTAGDPTSGMTFAANSLLDSSYPVMSPFAINGAFIGGRNVAAGAPYTSIDGVRFTSSLPTLQNSAQLASFNGLFYGATASGGNVEMRSQDGVTWYAGSTRATQDTGFIRRCANATALVMTTGATMVRTTNGTTWTNPTMPLDEGRGLFAAGTMMYSFGSVAVTTISYSTDSGATWLRTTGLASASYMKVAFCNGVYVLVSGTANTHYRSTNGTSWSLIASGQLPVVLTDIAADGTAFYAISAGSVYRSTDGTTWTLLSVWYGVYSSTTPTNLTNLDASTVAVIGLNAFGMCSAAGIAWRATSGYGAVANNTSSALKGSTVVFSGGVYGTFLGSYVLNDVNLKTHNVTAALQTDFYKRVA
jgi:hypothetical protein